MTSADRVAARFVAAANVRVVVDVPQTLEARRRHSMFPDLIVAKFAQPVTLYRVFDGEELQRILATGRITGGNYAVKAERSFGASWGSDRNALITMGNSLRGRRLGESIYLAELDAQGKTFAHLDPKVDFDPAGPDEQPNTMNLGVCNPGLGCSIMDAKLNEVDISRVERTGGTTRMTTNELKNEFKPEKKQDTAWGLKPKDKLYVTKGSKKLGVQIRYPATVMEVWQRPGEREVMVKLFFTWPLKPNGTISKKNELTLYALHPNRLDDPNIRLRNSSGDFIEVKRR